MAKAGSRVGSLYYQILLDGSGVEKQSQKIRKSISNVNKFLKRDGEERLDNERGINKRYEKLREDIMVAFKGDQAKMTEVLDAAEAERLDVIEKYQAKELAARKKVREDAEKEIEEKKVAAEELQKFMQDKNAKELDNVKKQQNSKDSWFKKNVQTRIDEAKEAEDEINKAKGKSFMDYLNAHKKENDRLSALDRKDMERRKNVQRRWDKRRKRNETERLRAAHREREDLARAHVKKMKLIYSIRIGGALGGVGGDGDDGPRGGFLGKLDGLKSKFGPIMAGIGKITIGLFVLEQAARKVALAIGAVVRTIGYFVSAAGKKKKEILTLTAVMGGNRKEAEKLREGLVQYAQATAFSVEQTMQMATQLKALGFETEAIIPAIEKFGRLSFGDPEKMKLIAKAYSDVKALGKLQAKEVMQFANQGVALRGQLMENLAMTAEELNKAIEDGRIKFEDVDKALTALTDKFGRTDLLGLETAAGQAEAMKESFDQMAAILGGPVEEALRDIIREFNIILDVMQKSGLLEGGAMAIEAMPAIQALKLMSQELKRIGIFLAINRVAWEHFFGDAESYKKAVEDMNNLINAEEIYDQAAAERERLLVLEKIAEQERKAAEKVAEAKKLAKERMNLLETLQAKKNAILTGDDSELRRIEERNRMEAEYLEMVDKYGEARAADIANQKHEIRLLEEHKKLEDIKMERLELEQKILGKDLSKSLPTKAFQQGSVDEFLYERQLEDQKKADERAARTEREANASRMAAAQHVVDGLIGMEISQDGNVTGV